MNPLIRAWLGDTSTSPQDPHFRELLPRLDSLAVQSAPGLALVLDLGVRFWSQQPLRLPSLSSTTALELARLVYDRNIGDPLVGKAERAAERARLLFVSHGHRTEAEAALAALDIARDARRALRPWQLAALNDFEHSDIPSVVLMEVRRVLHNTDPGADYAEVGGLRWVVWRLNGGDAGS